MVPFTEKVRMLTAECVGAPRRIGLDKLRRDQRRLRSIDPDTVTFLEEHMGRWLHIPLIGIEDEQTGKTGIICGGHRLQAIQNLGPPQEMLVLQLKPEATRDELVLETFICMQNAGIGGVDHRTESTLRIWRLLKKLRAVMNHYDFIITCSSLGVAANAIDGAWRLLRTRDTAGLLDLLETILVSPGITMHQLSYILVSASGMGSEIIIASFLKRVLLQHRHVIRSGHDEQTVPYNVKIEAGHLPTSYPRRNGAFLFSMLKHMVTYEAKPVEHLMKIILNWPWLPEPRSWSMECDMKEAMPELVHCLEELVVWHVQRYDDLYDEEVCELAESYTVSCGSPPAQDPMVVDSLKRRLAESIHHTSALARRLDWKRTLCTIGKVIEKHVAGTMPFTVGKHGEEYDQRVSCLREADCEDGTYVGESEDEEEWGETDTKNVPVYESSRHALSRLVKLLGDGSATAKRICWEAMDWLAALEYDKTDRAWLRHGLTERIMQGGELTIKECIELEEAVQHRYVVVAWSTGDRMSSAIYYNLSGKAKPWEPIMVCVDPVPDHEGVPWYTTWRVNMLDAIHRNLGIKPCARRANVYDVHTGEGGKPRGRCSRLDECLGAVYHPSNLLKKMHPERYPVIPDDMSLVPWQNGNELRQYALVMAEIAANTLPLSQTQYCDHVLPIYACRSRIHITGNEPLPELYRLLSIKIHSQTLTDGDIELIRTRSNGWDTALEGYRRCIDEMGAMW